jgi:hypothetical protein
MKHVLKQIIVNCSLSSKRTLFRRLHPPRNLYPTYLRLLTLYLIVIPNIQVEVVWARVQSQCQRGAVWGGTLAGLGTTAPRRGGTRKTGVRPLRNPSPPRSPPIRSKSQSPTSLEFSFTTPNLLVRYCELINHSPLMTFMIERKNWYWAMRRRRRLLE